MKASFILGGRHCRQGSVSVQYKVSYLKKSGEKETPTTFKMKQVANTLTGEMGLVTGMTLY